MTASLIVLVKIYLHKLKYLIKCPSQEKQQIKQKLRAHHKMFQTFSPWTRTCRLRCGIIKDVSCGKPHKIHSDQLFEEEDNRFWPNFGERQVQIADIGKDLEKEIDNLPFQPDARGQFLMRQYCELILTSYVDKGNWIAMTTVCDKSWK